MASKEVVAYRCAECELLATVEDAEESGPLYECAECGAIFTREGSMDGASHQCECGRFAAKVATYGCPECMAGELEPLVFAEEAAS